MFDIPCIIFSGGKSSRMGQNKALLPFGGYESLLEFQYKRLQNYFSEVYISTKKDHPFTFDAPFLLDRQVDFAPTAGFVSAFESLESERIMVLSVDTPFIDEDVFTTLLQMDSQDQDATIAKTSSGTHPMCGIYHRSLYEKFVVMLETSNHRLGKLLSDSKTLFVPFENELKFMNLNHPHEYQEAMTRFSEQEK